MDDPYDYAEEDTAADACSIALLVGTVYGFALGTALVGILWWVL